MISKNTPFLIQKSLLAKGKLIDLSQPIIMGILNVTPDSFFDGNQYIEREQILNRATDLVQQGAHIIDVGGYSTRPNAKNISVQEEMDRVIPTIQSLLEAFPELVISIDTFRPEVAKYALEAGANIVNDVLAGGEDMAMADLVAKYKVPYIIMHNVGNEQNMHITNRAGNTVVELLKFFDRKIYYLSNLGIADIIIDPGFGFSKSLDENYRILKNLHYLTDLNLPILVGLSRKSMIYKVLGTTPEQALNGTSALHMVALMNGANILRVHDVRQAKECTLLFNKIKDLIDFNI